MSNANSYCDLHALSADELHASHDILLHLNEHRKLLAKLRASEARAVRMLAIFCLGFGIHETYACFLSPWPNPPFPKRRPDFVEDGGGGGF